MRHFIPELSYKILQAQWSFVGPKKRRSFYEEILEINAYSIVDKRLTKPGVGLKVRNCLFHDLSFSTLTYNVDFFFVYLRFPSNVTGRTSNFYVVPGLINFPQINNLSFFSNLLNSVNIPTEK